MVHDEKKPGKAGDGGEKVLKAVAITVVVILAIIGLISLGNNDVRIRDGGVRVGGNPAYDHLPRLPRGWHYD